MGDVKTVEMENDQEDTEQALSADQKFKAELKQSCATKSQEWEVIKNTRQEELVALAETIKVLNDDDALELFKKTLPSASMSLMQVDQTMSAMRARALAALAKAKGHRPALDFISLALRGKSMGFKKVIGMIDEMSKNLAAEQKEDASDKRGETLTEKMNTEKLIGSLHGECDWLVKYFDVRKEARVGEVEALSNAKAVLSGADYSLIQSKSFLVRRHVQ